MSTSTPTGVIVGIHIAPEKRDPLRAVGEVAVVANQGIDGDRNFGRSWRRNVTFVEEEQLVEACSAIGVPYVDGCSRRNVTTRGIRLNELVGRVFTVGGVEFLGLELCQPCSVMESSVGPNAMGTLRDRAGIRTRALSSGTLRLGDAIRVTDEARDALAGRTDQGAERAASS